MKYHVSRNNDYVLDEEGWPVWCMSCETRFYKHDNDKMYHCDRCGCPIHDKCVVVMDSGERFCKPCASDT